MKERPILFSGPMIRAINDGRKTQTRRLLGLDTLKSSEAPGYDWTFRGKAPIRSIARQRRHPSGCWQDLTHAQLLALCPYGVVGDRLWVRETWQTTTVPEDRDVESLVFAADWNGDKPGFAEDEWSWRPSIFMPRWASRIASTITDVRVQRLQEISEEDAKAEGMLFRGPYWNGGPHPIKGHPKSFPSAKQAFADIWNHINAKRSPWELNPWVWVISFERVADVQP